MTARKKERVFTYVFRYSKKSGKKDTKLMKLAFVQKLLGPDHRVVCLRRERYDEVNVVFSTVFHYVIKIKVKTSAPVLVAEKLIGGGSWEMENIQFHFNQLRTDP